MDASATAAAAPTSDEAETTATAAAAGAVITTTGESETTTVAEAAAAETTTGGKCSGEACGGGDEQKQPSAKKMMQLPQAEIDFILAWRREPSPYPDDDHWALLSPEQLQLREEMAAIGKEFEDSFEEFQAEVRREVEEKGFYEFDESYYADQAEMQAQLKEGWAKIDWSDVVCADWDDFNDPNCCRSLY
ncbi:Os11g0603600 [Oryza sativa Japonica Group]|uniref:Os11g0603600 protein n=2 Tax=Oryza sativa subsp. japonica TaxID=39947 RepID=Q2R1I8_ORYSJ|nr:hypothetical protein LOC_Os11g39050 [Oryza sativa Japonica Group]EAZ18873.1 hypothetical protein OsJ_34412 [Oryza sativa Japonica Group]BAT14777.1 Os11g0603600 [Oryza sativa Japonica Group]